MEYRGVGHEEVDPLRFALGPYLRSP
jgi:hypothetical protein